MLPEGTSTVAGALLQVAVVDNEHKPIKHE